jgi:ketosteroid isomerase-like protein
MAISTTQAIERAIQATNRAFETAIAQGNAAGAAAAYTANGQALPPNDAIVSGRADLQKLWQGVMDIGVKRVTLETLELHALGDGAYEVGMATLSGEGGKVLDTVKFVVVWQQEDGQWKWHRDIWNSMNS